MHEHYHHNFEVSLKQLKYVRTTALPQQRRTCQQVLVRTELAAQIIHK
jgi:hypothetical protein